MAYDKNRVVTLAPLLDEDRGVSEESNLASILRGMSERGDSDNVSSSTDALDVAIAYLRRVHLIVYYSGKSFLNEAQMIATAQSVICRSRPPLPPAGSEDKDNNKEENGTETEAEVEKVDDVKENEDDDEGNEDGKDNDEKKNGSDEENQRDDEEQESYLREYDGRTYSTIAAMDKRVKEIILSVKQRVERKRAGLEVSDDSRDAEVIAEAQNKVQKIVI